MSIATKTGDAGETALMYGRRVPKMDRRVEAYGTVDELNAALGLVRATTKVELIQHTVLAVQKELVVLMGELAVADEDRDRYQRDGYDIVTSAMVDGLTAVVDDSGAESPYHLQALGDSREHFGWGCSRCGSNGLSSGRAQGGRSGRQRRACQSGEYPLSKSSFGCPLAFCPLRRR